MTDVPQTTPEGIPIPRFEPWRPQRARVNGWTADVQHAFIAALTRIGCANAAAKAVGKSRRSAYLLRDKEGAESFAAAWECALLEGRRNARTVAINRALHGDVEPQFRDGRFIGYKTIRNDRLLIAAASSRASFEPGVAEEEHSLSEYRYQLGRWESALRRREMDQANGGEGLRRNEDEYEAWERHVIWREELQREKRRQMRAEYRAAARRALAPPEARIRLL